MDGMPAVPMITRRATTRFDCRLRDWLAEAGVTGHEQDEAFAILRKIALNIGKNSTSADPVSLARNSALGVSLAEFFTFGKLMGTGRMKRLASKLPNARLPKSTKGHLQAIILSSTIHGKELEGKFDHSSIWAPLKELWNGTRQEIRGAITTGVNQVTGFRRAAVRRLYRSSTSRNGGPPLR